MNNNQIHNPKDSVSTNTTTESPYKFLLRWFSPNEEQAERQYKILRQKLAALFGIRGVPSPINQELADETLERVGQRLAEGEIIHNSEPMAYLHGVANNVLLEYWRKQQKRAAKEVSLDDLLLLNSNKLEFSFQSQVESEERERWLECLDKFLSALPPEEEALLRSCYQDSSIQQAANRRVEAKRLNLTDGSLRANLYRICQRLKPKVRACVERRQK